MGYAGWTLSSGTLSAYDATTKKHAIEWDDGGGDWEVDLMACRKCRGWRFVQPGEDKEAVLGEGDDTEDTA